MITLCLPGIYIPSLNIHWWLHLDSRVPGLILSYSPCRVASGSGERNNVEKSKDSFRSLNLCQGWKENPCPFMRGLAREWFSTPTPKGTPDILPKTPVNCADCVCCHFFSLQGHLATCGLVQCLGTPMQEDSVLVKVLKRQGAIPFAMTNVPQSLFR